MQEPKIMEMNRAIPDGIMAYAGHPYVKTIAKNGDIYYTDEFYAAMVNAAPVKQPDRH